MKKLRAAREIKVVQTRRDFICCTAAGALSLGSVGPLRAAENHVQFIELLALHTNEYLQAPYRVNGELLDKNLPAIHRLLRDHRTDEVHAIDPRLLDYLHDLGLVLGFGGPFHVISGYRSAATNARLRQASNGVAKRSFHMYGRAVDIRVPGVSSAQVRAAAIELRRGGVGHYPGSNFVHLDTGNFRHW